MTDLIKTGVSNTGLTNLIQRLGRDCSPQQYLREFVWNGIEAVLRTESADKEVIVDVDWEYYDEKNVFKI